MEYALTPTTVSGANFGKLFSCTLDSPGYVYAEPLYIANLSSRPSQAHRRSRQKACAGDAHWCPTRRGS